MRKITHNYLKPQHYYNRLFLFFVIISITLTLTLNRWKLNISLIDIYLLQATVFFFLLMAISVFVEHFKKGEYMGPLEIYDVEQFFRTFQRGVYSGDINKYLHKYDHKTKTNLEHVLNKKVKFFLSTIRKIDGVYELTIINEHKFYQYFIIKFLAKRAIHKLYVKLEKGEFKIARFI